MIRALTSHGVWRRGRGEGEGEGVGENNILVIIQYHESSTISKSVARAHQRSMKTMEPSTSFAAGLAAFTAGLTFEIAAELLVTLLATARFCFGAIMSDAAAIERNMQVINNAAPFACLAFVVDHKQP